MSKLVFIGTGLLILTFSSFISEAQNSQKDVKPITINGQSIITTQYANRQGTNQEIPASYLRWNLSNTFNVYGLPLRFGLLLSTENNASRQRLNAYTFDIDFKSYLRNKAIDHLGFLKHFRTFEIGTFRPRYSKFTLQGIAVNGVNVEFQPGNFYMAFANGTSKRAVTNKNYPDDESFDRKILFGKIGYGKPDKSHFYLTLMHAEDETGSLNPSPDPWQYHGDTLIHESDTFYHPPQTYNRFLKPRENLLAGSELSLKFFQQKLELRGEVAASLITRDKESPDLLADENEFEGFITDIYMPNTSSSIDYAYDIGASFKEGNTSMEAGMKKIGPGYESLGIAYLRKDKLEYNARLSQRLFRRKLSVRAFYKTYHNNLLEWSHTGTSYTSFGLGMTLRLRDLPYLSVNYSPFHQETESEQNLLSSKATMLSVNTGHTYKIGELRSSTNFSYSLNKNDIESATMDQSITSQNFSFSESLSFLVPLTLTAGVGYHSIKRLDQSDKITTVYFRGSYGKYNGWRNMLGIRFSAKNSESKKTGFSFTSTMKASEFAKFQLTVRQNIFTDTVTPVQDYDEFIARLSIILIW